MRNRYDFKDRNKIEIENALFFRDISSLCQLLNGHTKKNRTQTPDKEDLDIINLLNAPPPISEAEWKVADQNGGESEALDVIYGFEETLERYALSLPPGFDKYKYWYDLVPDSTQKEFACTALRRNLIAFVASKSYRQVFHEEE